MPNNELGEIRRSSILVNGPGAIVNFRTGEHGGGAVSVITAGLETWEKSAKIFPNSLRENPNIIREPRLESNLSKDYFRMAPVKPEDDEDKKYKPHIKGVRFPIWLQCPECGDLKEEYNFASEPGEPARWCAKCTEKMSHKVYAVPAKFVVACENGHISDFPWRWYLQNMSSKEACKDKPCKLQLKSDGSSSSLRSLILSCKNCEAKTSMADIFETAALSHFKCPGTRPWLNNESEDCKCQPKTIQRGASNIYFPILKSALCIPPWNRTPPGLPIVDWSELTELNASELEQELRGVVKHQKLYGIEFSEFFEIAKRRIGYEKNDNKNIREDEFRRFMETEHEQSVGEEEHEFEIMSQIVPPILETHIESLIKVDRLTEVQVQTGFTRIIAPLVYGGAESSSYGKLSLTELDWLPASKIKGEGIFFSLRKSKIDEWLSNSPEMQTRCGEIQESLVEEYKARKLPLDEQNFQAYPTFIILHTLAHIVMRQISLTSGYSNSALRERIYCEGRNQEMAGILIYTGTNDSEGTLGGLARLAEPERFEQIFIDAINQAQWCSSDPLCIDGISSTAESQNKAACHACVLAPETSCEFFNRFLDRALIVGTLENPNSGFFSDLINRDLNPTK